MKSIKFSNKEVVITYNNEEEAQKIGKWAEWQLLKDFVSVEGNVFTYDISTHNDKFYFMMRLVKKVAYDFDFIGSEVYSSAFSTDKYDYVIDCYLSSNENKLFRITPINKDGTLGTLDFGVHQYTPLFRISKLNNTGEFFFLSGRYHVGKFENQELKLGDVDDYSCQAILIEVGDIQF
ncbi:MAG: hypothetical protein IKG40_01595 [Bacilli bacterium]|nr:hypothetical protein [Bacilli bacterium]